MVVLAVAIFALILGWAERERRIVQHRKDILKDLAGHAAIGNIYPPMPCPAIRRLFGDESVPEIALLRDTFTESQLAAVRDAFPEADVWIADEIGPFGPMPFR
jgi:hypothetical protein